MRLSTQSPKSPSVLASAMVAALVGATACGGAFDPSTEYDLTEPTAADLTAPVEPKFGSLYGDYLSTCKQCHAPGAPGATLDTEKSLDFTTRTTAYTTLTTKMASGLVGNQATCNGVSFVVPGKPGESLLVATLDAEVRQAFDLVAAPTCDVDAITDETVKVGSPPTALFVTALKQWITDGALDN